MQILLVRSLSLFYFPIHFIFCVFLVSSRACLVCCGWQKLLGDVSHVCDILVWQHLSQDILNFIIESALSVIDNGANAHKSSLV